MPTNPLKNLIYRALLFRAPSPYKIMRHTAAGQVLNHLPYYEHLMVRHHVLGASLLLSDGARCATLHTTVTVPMHVASDETIYRVASITKMATALTTLSCIADGLFTLETVACLGACGLAPVVTINDQVHSKMTPESMIALLDQLRKEERANG